MNDDTGWWLDEYDGPKFWRYVDRNGGTEYQADPLASAEGECWVWNGSLDKLGYGRFQMGRKSMLAHRVAYLDGSRTSRIPEGWVIDHLCRNASCVRPDHLEAVDHATNVARGARGKAALTACPSGHKYTPETTRVITRANGREFRRCKICLKASAQRAYKLRKQPA